jgi:hypothetical protein
MVPTVYALALPKCFNLDTTSFVHMSINAQLPQQVNGIVGQTNTLCNPPLHVGHGNAIY